MYKNSYYLWEEKTVVDDFKDYKIVVDKPGHATLISAWTEDGRRVGILSTLGAFSHTGYLNVDYVSVEPMHRGNGLIDKMYKTLLKNLDPKWDGISYTLSKKQIPSILENLGAKKFKNNSNLIVVDRDKYLKKAAKEELTDFPSKGEDFVITLLNSKYPQANYNYCKKIKENYPELWEKGGNVYGNKAFEYWTKYRRGDRSLGVMKWIKKREAWFARHWKNHEVPGIIAWLKWGGYGHLGESKVKQILREEMSKIDEQKKKTAAGLTDLKGLDVKIGKIIADAIYNIYNEEDIKVPTYFQYTLDGYMKRKGYFHDYGYGYGLDQFLDTTLLKNTVANSLLNSTYLRLDTVGSIGVFGMAAGTPVISLNYLKIIESSMLFGRLDKSSLTKNIISTLGHELHHAIDWAYTKANKKDFYADKRHERKKQPDYKDIEYYNTDTELKSYAYTVADVIFGDVNKNSVRELRDILDMTSSDLKYYFNRPAVKSIVDQILPENKKKFMQRVFNVLRKKTIGAYKNLYAKSEKEFPLDEEPKYQWGKSRSKWV